MVIDSPTQANSRLQANFKQLVFKTSPFLVAPPTFASCRIRLRSLATVVQAWIAARLLICWPQLFSSLGSWFQPSVSPPWVLLPRTQTLEQAANSSNWASHLSSAANSPPWALWGKRKDTWRRLYDFTWLSILPYAIGDCRDWLFRHSDSQVRSMAAS